MELKGHRKEVARKEIGATGKYRESSDKRPQWTDSRVTCLS